MNKGDQSIRTVREIAEPSLVGLRHREWRLLAIIIGIKALFFLFAG